MVKNCNGTLIQKYVTIKETKSVLNKSGEYELVTYMINKEIEPICEGCKRTQCKDYNASGKEEVNLPTT